MGELINLFDRKKKAIKEEIKEIGQPAVMAFKEQAKKNVANEERQHQERLAANKKVLRSYRIK